MLNHLPPVPLEQTKEPIKKSKGFGVAGMLDNVGRSSSSQPSESSEPFGSETSDKHNPLLDDLQDIGEVNVWGMLAKETANPLYRFMFRWTEHPKNNQELFADGNAIVDKLRTSHNCKKVVMQLEKGESTGKLHYQGYVSLKNDRKKRVSTLVKSLNKDFFGIEVRVAFDSNLCTRYCTKEETRFGGPFTYP